jgi:hypothetical protein
MIEGESGWRQINSALSLRSREVTGFFAAFFAAVFFFATITPHPPSALTIEVCH